jgi:hypothetical protein
LLGPLGFQVVLPLASVRAVCRDDADIIAFHVHCDQHVERVRAGSAEYEIAREVLVVWIRLHKFNGFDGPENKLPKYRLSLSV